MSGLLPIMCAAALNMMYSGEVTSVIKLQVRQDFAFFSGEVPNYGLLAGFIPEVWQMGITLREEGSKETDDGILLLKQAGPPQFHKGQLAKVSITACSDNGMYAALARWNAFASPFNRFE